MTKSPSRTAAPDGGRQDQARTQQAAGRIRHMQNQQRAGAKKPRLLGGGVAPQVGVDGHPSEGAAEAPFVPISELLPAGWQADSDWLPTAWEALSGAALLS